MKFVPISILIAFGLAGCATPITYLKNANGDVVHCGGGSAGAAFGGMLGYSIEQSNDASCVNNYKANGYKPFYPE